MKKINWMSKAIGAAALLAFVVALGAPTPVAAIANPRGQVWGVGSLDVRILKSGTLIQTKPPEYTADTTQSAVEESSTVINTASFQLLTSSGGVVTPNTTPSISTTTVDGASLATGKIIILMGTSDANAVDLTDDDTLSGSQIELGASTRRLGANDVLVLIWNATASTSGRWAEVSYSNLD